MEAKHIHQLKLVVSERDQAGRAVGAGTRCLQLAVGVRDRAVAAQGQTVSICQHGGSCTYFPGCETIGLNFEVFF